MKNKSSSLWTQSSCSLAFPEHNIIFKKQKRFSVDSIYHKQKYHLRLPLKMQIIRPESCLIQFRRQIHNSPKYAKARSYQGKSPNIEPRLQAVQPNGHNNSASFFQEEVIQRLSPSQQIRLDKLFDRNGIRSTFYQSSGQQVIRYSFKKSRSLQGGIIGRSFQGPKVYVSGSTRIDLSKPQNFNPGPGSYFLAKKDDEQISKLYQKARKSTTKKISQKSKFEKKSKLDENIENSHFFKDLLDKQKKRQKKSKLVRTSMVAKQKSQFIFLNRN